jgi:hypothetical protein
LSRYEGKLTAAGEALLAGADHSDLGTGEARQGRYRAIARCLALDEGWEEAVRELRGAFAADAAERSRLSGRQAG